MTLVKWKNLTCTMFMFVGSVVVLLGCCVVGLLCCYRVAEVK